MSCASAKPGHVKHQRSVCILSLLGCAPKRPSHMKIPACSECLTSLEECSIRARRKGPLETLDRTPVQAR
jgi:hypothetical protein